MIYRRKNSEKRDPEKQICYWCGDAYYAGHKSECKARNKKCARCGKVGHLSKMCKSKTTRAGWVDKKAEKLKKIREEEAKTETESEIEDPKTETEPETDDESVDPDRASSSAIKFGKAKRINEIDTADQETIVVKINKPDEEKVTPEVI